MTNLAPLPSPAPGAPAQSPYTRMLRRQQIMGLAVIVLFGGTLGVWSMTTVLSGAVAAGGQFVVASEVKKVQHPQGGVVGELLVKEGSRVAAGDIVVRLDATMPRANFQIVSKQINEFAIRRARLEAERDGEAAMTVPAEFEQRRGQPEIEKLIAAETRLFDVRRSARDGQRAQLRKRVAQLRDEIVGLTAQRAAKERESQIIANELIGVRDLFARNLVQLTRLSALERDAASIEGQRGQLIAAVAQSEGKIAETELQVIQIEETLRAEVSGELREIQAKEGEMVERRTAAEDQLKRIDLRSPSAGTVHQMLVHTVGGVLGPGEAAMLIVPQEDELQLDARIAPSDIDQIGIGQIARVKVQAGHQSQTPELVGTVVRMSADVTRDERAALVYYTVRIALPRSELERIAPVKLIAGMQAEAYIETTARTPLAFLTKPLTDQFARTFRER